MLEKGPIETFPIVPLGRKFASYREWVGVGDWRKDYTVSITIHYFNSEGIDCMEALLTDLWIRVRVGTGNVGESWRVHSLSNYAYDVEIVLVQSLA